MALHLDGPVHHLHQVKGNGQAQPCSLGLTDPLILRPLKGSEHLFLKCLSHADPVILHNELKAAHTAPAGQLFFQ